MLLALQIRRSLGITTETGLFYCKEEVILFKVVINECSYIVYRWKDEAVTLDSHCAFILKHSIIKTQNKLKGNRVNKKCTLTGDIRNLLKMQGFYINFLPAEEIEKDR